MDFVVARFSCRVQRGQQEGMVLVNLVRRKEQVDILAGASEVFFVASEVGLPRVSHVRFVVWDWPMTVDDLGGHMDDTWSDRPARRSWVHST